MLIEKIPAGKSVPDNINVIIEIPADGVPVKYEADKEFGAMVVDRFLNTAMHYPCNYGFVPHTLADDGDPVDVLVVTPIPLRIGVVIACRPIGMLKMTDESGEDAKVLAVPVDKLTPLYRKVKEAADLPDYLLRMIEHFFTHYKELDEGKWAKVDGWESADVAKKVILAGVENYKS